MSRCRDVAQDPLGADPLVEEMTEQLRDLVGEILVTQSAPGGVVVLGSAALALALVWLRPAWSVTRHVVTVVHEGAHGVVATLGGRRLSGIRLHSDSSGVTVSSGRPTGPGMIATAAAGYVGPALLGLGAAALVSGGYAVAMLWSLLLGLALLLVQIRNFFGLWVVLLCGAVVVAVTGWLDEEVQVAVAHVLAWFLLLAAPRAVLELHAGRRRGGARGTDADQLGRLTVLPAPGWVAFFLTVTTASLLCGGALLLASAEM